MPLPVGVVASAGTAHGPRGDTRAKRKGVEVRGRLLQKERDGNCVTHHNMIGASPRKQAVLNGAAYTQLGAGMGAGPPHHVNYIISVLHRRPRLD